MSCDLAAARPDGPPLSPWSTPGRVGVACLGVRRRGRHVRKPLRRPRWRVPRSVRKHAASRCFSRRSRASAPTPPSLPSRSAAIRATKSSGLGPWERFLHAGSRAECSAWPAATRRSPILGSLARSRLCERRWPRPSSATASTISTRPPSDSARRGASPRRSHATSTNAPRRTAPAPSRASTTSPASATTFTTGRSANPQ
jgi:hypothetical protein